jgi:3-oxoacyl-[acyl-carrier-protein] synthase III
MSQPVRVAITGTGSYLPARVLTNADLEKMVDTSDEWIVSRTGIRERRVAAPNEASSDLGAAACRAALASAGLSPGDIDLIVCSTLSPDMPAPSTACFIQKELGAGRIPAFDVAAACSGFVYAMEVGRQLVAGGTARRALVVAAEVSSRVTDYTDRDTCVLFGDGAGAVVIERGKDPSHGVLAAKLFTDGAGWEMIHIPAGGSRAPASDATLKSRGHFFKMHGREVFKFVVRIIPAMIEEILGENGFTVDDVRLIIPHQVNYRIFQAAAERLGIADDRIYSNLARCGNTSSASIPIALDEAARSGGLKDGDLVLLLGFGSGLTWGSMLIRWGK